MLQLPGVELYVEACGGIPATIFVHGFGGDLRTWGGLWELLPSERGYVRYDLRGFGKSSAVSDSSFRHADDLLNLMDALQIDRCDLVGTSMGGSIAINFALSWPDRIRSLALFSPALMAWEWSDEWRARWRSITAAARSGEMGRAKSLWLAHPVFETITASNTIQILWKEVSGFSGDQWIRDHQALALPDVEMLHELELPILLLTGARDLADFRLIAELIQACALNVTRYDAADLGHMVHLEAPEWCRDKLTAFWESATGGPTDR